MDVVGPSFAKEIFFTARQFDAEEARMMGFVNRVVPDAELESYVKNYGDTIAGNAPLTIGAAKHAVSELLKDEAERDIDAVVAEREALLRQQGLCRGPHRLHGKAQAGVQGACSFEFLQFHFVKVQMFKSLRWSRRHAKLLRRAPRISVHRPFILRGSLRSHLRMTDQMQ